MLRGSCAIILAALVVCCHADASSLLKEVGEILQENDDEADTGDATSTTSEVLSESNAKGKRYEAFWSSSYTCIFTPNIVTRRVLFFICLTLAEKSI
ncbi:hypothetical protein OESDEN_06401 [Oesophagostomum dentatum]|uniref:Secreted protein n=1 Tax=Oesophagostomum dentatum TaxID=61180 RepID=A0A0B1T8Z1_OESDE|nr:hypothetical protein OESDEN_06401 [Oesophagostomum dentatum]